MNKTIKWVLIVIVFAFVANVIKESVKASSETDARIMIEESCAQQANSGGAIPLEEITKVCSCTTERAAKQLGSGGFVRLQKTGNAASESDRQILTDALLTCTQEHVNSQ